MAKFPRTIVAGIDMPRMIAGTNWIAGYSHTGAAADQFIADYHSQPGNAVNVFKTFLSNGIDAIMGCFQVGYGSSVLAAMRQAEEAVGQKMIIIDTPHVNVDDNAEGRAAAEKAIKASKQLGATFCLIHHSSAEQLVNKNLKAMPRLPDYLDMIRQNGMIPGLSAHMPELVLYSDANEYDVQTYIQIFNCMGFLMQIEIESVYKIIMNAKKPVMTIKAMAAGRCTPFVGLTFNFSVLRDCDMVVCGCLNADEAEEDIEFARAAIEHRPPVVQGRSSPNKTEIIK
ncbi:MAG: hypothetical protein GX946_06995 [Oligosphaeraceae bacterium]|nr:hypothetical protein [Oligosphaeraceae bacterium]